MRLLCFHSMNSHLPSCSFVLRGFWHRWGVQIGSVRGTEDSKLFFILLVECCNANAECWMPHFLSYLTLQQCSSYCNLFCHPYSFGFPQPVFKPVAPIIHLLFRRSLSQTYRLIQLWLWVCQTSSCLGFFLFSEQLLKVKKVLKKSVFTETLTLFKRNTHISRFLTVSLFHY